MSIDKKLEHLSASALALKGAGLMDAKAKAATCAEAAFEVLHTLVALHRTISEQASGLGQRLERIERLNGLHSEAE